VRGRRYKTRVTPNAPGMSPGRPGGLPSLSPRPDAGDGLPPLAGNGAGQGSAEGLPPLGPGSGAEPGVTSPRPAATRLGPPAGASPAPPPARRRRSSRRRAGLGIVAAVALAAAAGAGALVSQLVEGDSRPATAAPAPSGSGRGLLSLTAAIAAVEPSVVEVQGSLAQGSGVVVAPNGLIVTNEHVVSGEATLDVTTADDRRISAQVIATDPNSDLAVLRPVGPPGPGVRLAEEPDGGLRQGDTVFAIGSPFGLRNSVTSGVVSSLGRRGDRGQPVIQTDTPINPGNSGGGLFDLRGRLVGIPTEIRSPVPGNVGIGFAVTTEPIKALLAKVS